MIYTNSEVRLLRWMVIALSICTVVAAFVTFLQNHSSSEVPLILGALVAGWALYLVVDWVLPKRLSPIKVIPPSRPRPSPIPVWDEGSEDSSPSESGGPDTLRPIADTRS